MRLNAKKAFTLVEMLIVIVIIGILAAALIPRLTGIQARARDVARKGDLQQISTALATFQLDNGVYITTGATPRFLTAFTGGGQVGLALQQGLVSGGLLKALPIEQQTSAMPYQYASYASGGVFALASANEGGGISANWTGASATTIAQFTGSTTLTTTSQITTQLCERVDMNATTSARCNANPTLNLAKYAISN